jgi:hypothetical protein
MIDVQPVFTRPRYSEFFFHCASTVPGWLPKVVVANAEAESYGSKKLFWLWRGATANSQISSNVMIHAKDEARHSRVFLSLVEEAFPDSIPADLLQSHRAQLFRVPRASTEARFTLPEDTLIDHLVQMNMGEIRTRVHMLLLAPVIYAFTPSDGKERVRAALEGLVTDEIRHIRYTAQFIESWCVNGDKKRIQALYRRRMKDFHKITVEQTQASIHAYGAGRYPDLLEI